MDRHANASTSAPVTPMDRHASTRGTGGERGTEPEQRKKGSASARHVMDRHTRAKGEWEEDDRVAQLSKESEGQRENWVWLYNESK